jgi:thiol-disulfide isomerase/thioredoxin
MLKSRFLCVTCAWTVFVFCLPLFSGCAGHPAHPANASAPFSFANDPLFQSDENPKQTWDALQQSFLQLDPPKSWFTNHPSAQVMADWKKRKAQMALLMADQSRDFYLRYPNVPQAARAHDAEYNLLEIVVNSGDMRLLSRLTALDKQKLADPLLTEDDRFALKAHIIERNANLHEAEGVPVVMAHLESGSRELLKEFPDNPHAWQFLVTVADQEQDPKKSRLLAREILTSNAAEPSKEFARRILGRLDHLGKPIPFQGVALDGRPINLSKMKGKIVMFHFWETDCGYCVEELADIKDIYEKFHSQGLEIISISFDHDKDRLAQSLEQSPMPWPQYFAGTDWNVIHGRDFDIQGIPTVWLVDRRGNLCDLNARENLTSKVEQLLKEP